MSKSIKKNLIYNIALNISKVVFPLVTAPYVSRVLEPDGVGLFNFSSTYAGYFALFAVLGIPLYGVREIAKLRESNDEINKYSLCDNALAKERYGWIPKVGIEEGLRNVIRYESELFSKKQVGKKHM